PKTISMKLRWIALFGLLAFFAQPALAQKLKVEQGSTNILNGVSKMNISYDYSDMSVGKFKTEAEYITKKKEEYNKKEAGKGDKWEADWKADRTDRYAPQFEELF